MTTIVRKMARKPRLERQRDSGPTPVARGGCGAKAHQRVYVCICMDSAGPAGSSLAQDLYGSGRHESGICTSPSPRPWRARRLDSTVWTLVFG